MDGAAILAEVGFELGFTLAVLVTALALFVSDRVRLDVVAMGALVALMLGGIVSVREAAGFGDPLVVMIAGLFLVGEGIARTGVARRAGHALARVGGKSEARLVAGSMATSALLSAFMSSTGAVALLIPVVLGVARDAGVSPSRLLLPLSFGSLLGGMLTLIGTPPNLVASAALAEAGRAPFRFLDFTGPGLVMTVGSMLLLTGLARRLLPSRAAAADESAGDVPLLGADQLVEEYDLGETTQGFRVGPAFADTALRELALPERFGVAVERMEPGPDEPPGPLTRVPRGGVVVLQGAPEALARAAAELGLEPLSSADLRELLARSSRAAEIVLTPRSQLLSQTVKEARFRDRFGLTVVGIRRLGTPMEHPLGDVRLRFGDTLLVRGPPSRLKAIRSQLRQFVLVGEVGGAGGPSELERRAPVAVAVVAAMVVLLVTGVVPAVAAVLLAAGAMVFTRCVELPGAYRAVSWESLVLIAGMLPMATALERTGGIDHAARALVEGVGGLGPRWTLAALFLATSSLSLLMSNTATSVLMAPVALRAGLALGVNPEAFLMAVALGASTAFSTPMASPTNTLVLVPGQYRFRDYLRAGAPLQALVFALTVLVVPWFWPFG